MRKVNAPVLFVFSKSILSDCRDSRLAGNPFSVGDGKYYPAQLCESRYGEAVIIKRIVQHEAGIDLIPVRKIVSSHPKLKEGMHTLNERNGTIVVDVKGYNYPIIAKIYSTISKLYKHFV